MDDTYYMQKAIQLALKAEGYTSPNPMVGCVIVKNNKIIAEGWHKYCGADHAEIMALKIAKGKARGATMYITLEPCFHYGLTPPCVEQVIKAGIKKVVIGMKDPNPLTNGKSIARLHRTKITVKVGVLEEELEKMNEVFIKYIKSRMPFVVTKCAQTLDGKIATAQGQSQWITSLSSRHFARRLRHGFDAICVGIKTVLKDDPRLTTTNSEKVIKRIILDSHLRISPSARLFRGIDPSSCFIATTAKAPQKKIDFFQKKNVNVLITPEKEGHIDLTWLFKELANRGITSILIEGGAHVIGMALKENLVDKMHVYIAPKILGDQKALSSVVGLRTEKLNQAKILRNITFQKIGQDVLISGYVYRHH